MKRTELIKHLTKHNCILTREGGRHTLYFNPATGLQTAVPRHSEIADLLCKAICKQLGIPQVKK